jgi:hypothetical protein
MKEAFAESPAMMWFISVRQFSSIACASVSLSAITPQQRLHGPYTAVQRQQSLELVKKNKSISWNTDRLF